MIQEASPELLVNGHKSPAFQPSKVSASDSAEDGSARENNLYVKNLPPDIDDARLERMFNAHGTVLSCRVLYDHTSRSKQVAFVQMETHQQALKSIEALHSTQASTRPGAKPLHVALAQNKQERQRKARQAARARAVNGSACSERSWHTLRSRQGLPARGANVRQGRPPTGSGYQALAGSYYPAGAGPFYVAQYVPYTPASYIAHQAPPGAYAYSGIHGPGPAAVYSMMPPSNGHASPHMIPVGPYQQPMAPYMAAPAVHGPPAGNTWSPRTGSWSVQGSYAPKVQHAEPGPGYAQQQMMMPMPHQASYQHPLRM